jgi:hypothetical protein
MWQCYSSERPKTCSDKSLLRRSNIASVAMLLGMVAMLLIDPLGICLCGLFRQTGKVILAADEPVKCLSRGPWILSAGKFRTPCFGQAAAAKKTLRDVENSGSDPTRLMKRTHSVLESKGATGHEVHADDVGHEGQF